MIVFFFCWLNHIYIFERVAGRSRHAYPPQNRMPTISNNIYIYIWLGLGLRNNNKKKTNSTCSVLVGASFIIHCSRFSKTFCLCTLFFPFLSLSPSLSQLQCIQHIRVELLQKPKEKYIYMYVCERKHVGFNPPIEYTIFVIGADGKRPKNPTKPTSRSGCAIVVL